MRRPSDAGREVRRACYVELSDGTPLPLARTSRRVRRLVVRGRVGRFQGEGNMSDSLRDFEAQLAAYEEPETLILDVGESVAFQVTGTGSVPSDYGKEDAPTVEGVTGDGTYFRVIGYSTVLNRELTKANLQPGDVAGIVRLPDSTKAKAGQHPAKIYRVLVKERGQMGQAVEAAKMAALATPTSSAIEEAAIAKARSAQAIAEEASIAAAKAAAATDEDEALAAARKLIAAADSTAIGQARTKQRLAQESNIDHIEGIPDTPRPAGAVAKEDEVI
jgi:hypothetical protein